MNSFTVVSAVYDGTAPGDPNPMVLISGTVNGKNVFPRIFFRYLDAANNANGMQVALTALLWNWYSGVFGYQLTPWPQPIPFPTFPASNAVATPSSGPYPVAPVVYSPALLAPWSA